MTGLNWQEIKSAPKLSNSVYHSNKLYGLYEMRSMPGRFNVSGILLSTIMPRQDIGPSVCTRAMYLWVNRTDGEAGH
jgi:hypothetical protein